MTRGTTRGLSGLCENGAPEMWTPRKIDLVAGTLHVPSERMEEVRRRVYDGVVSPGGRVFRGVVRDGIVGSKKKYRE